MGLLFKTELGGGGGEEGYVHTELSLILSDTELIGQYYAIFLINENGTRKQVIPKTGTKTFTGTDKVIIESLGNYVIKYGADASLDRETTYSLKEIKATDSVTISSASFYTEWLATAEIEESAYPTLEDLLTEGEQNEKDVRKLMTVHASADKLIEWYNDNPSDFPLSTFTSSRIAMKWIGLRDYICDKLMAIEAVKTALLGSEHWEYILKDKVPIMTANNAPEGTVIYNQSYQGSEWQAFDGKTNTWGTSKFVNKVSWFGYTFENPICVRKYYLKNNNFSGTYQLQGCNGDVTVESNWENVEETPNTITTSTNEYTFNVQNDKYYKSYRLYVTTPTSDNGVGLDILQFYGRSLNESVPVMTGYTTPIGEVNANSIRDDFPPHKAFTGTNINQDDSYVSHNSPTALIYYKFVKPICIKQVYFENRNYSDANGRPKTYRIVASNTGNTDDWHPLTSEITRSNTANQAKYPERINMDNDNSYLYYGLDILEAFGNYAGVGLLNFYGVSYSEEEFGDEGIEMLYDHGVFNDESSFDKNGYYGSRNNGSITLGADAIEVKSTGAFQPYLQFKVDNSANKYDKAIIEVNDKTNNFRVTAHYFASKMSAGATTVSPLSASDIDINTNKSTDALNRAKLASILNDATTGNWLSATHYTESSGQSSKLTKLYLIKKGA